MNMEQIEAFIYVSLTGNFSKAGEILYISQPSVSNRVKTLENEIGYSLFNRQGKHIMLTKEGEIFLPYAKRVWQSLQDGVTAIQQKNSLAEGSLSISTALTASVYILPDLIKDFHEFSPKIKLIVHTGHSPDVLDMVLNHEVSLGISRSVSHPEIETIHLLDDEMVLVIYPNHVFSSRKTVSIEEVANENLILFNRGSLDRTLINNAFASMGIKPNVALEVDNIELVKQMIKKELGIGILPKIAIEEEAKLNKLQLIKINGLPHLHTPFQLIHLKDTKIEGMLKIFVDFIRGRVKK